MADLNQSTTTTITTQQYGEDPYKTNKFYSTQAFSKNIFLGVIGATSFYSHFNPFRRVWEYLIIFVTLITPMEILFVALISPDLPIYVYCVTFLFDILLAIDIYIIRHTAILHNGEILTKPKKISKVYGYWALIIQIIACIPLAWIGIIIHNRVVYIILSLNKLLRLHRGYTAYHTTSTLLPYVGGPLTILPVVFFLIFAIDIFATIFIVIAEAQEFENSWVAPYHERGFTKVQCFFVAIYFVLTTILTIGFGDISPITTAEVVVTIFIQLIGVSMQAAMTSIMVAILIDPTAADFVQRYKVMMDFLTFKKVDHASRKAVHNYYQYQFERTGCTGNVKHILKTLPVSLRSTIKLEMTKAFFEQTKSFTGLSNKQLIKIVDVMSFKTFSPHDVIVVQGEMRDRLFFFRSGIIAIIQDGRNTMTQTCEGGIVDGELEMFVCKVNPNGIVAMTYVEAWVLKLEDMINLMQHKNDIRYLILNQLYQLYRDREYDFEAILANTVPDENLRNHVKQMILNNNRAARSSESNLHHSDVSGNENQNVHHSDDDESDEENNNNNIRINLESSSTTSEYSTETGNGNNN